MWAPANLDIDGFRSPCAFRDDVSVLHLLPDCFSNLGELWVQVYGIGRFIQDKGRRGWTRMECERLSEIAM